MVRLIKENLSAREQYAPLIVKPSGRAEIRYTSRYATHLNLSPLRSGGFFGIGIPQLIFSQCRSCRPASPGSSQARP
jgi:hypothetical protein